MMGDTFSGNATHRGTGSFAQGGQGNTITTTTNTGSAAPTQQAQAAAGAEQDRARKVFIVHGRDEQARRAMFELVRRIDLHPLEWEALVHAVDDGSPFIGEVVANAPRQAQAALVLLTPDDIVSLHPALRGIDEPAYETQRTCQPRPNVLIELGMVLTAYPQRTIIVEFGGLRPIGDLLGRHTVRFDGSTESVHRIIGRLKQAGCAADDSAVNWRDTSVFEGLDAYRRIP
jgi:hypothetical protein